MGDVVNLRLARKRAKRDEDARLAQENRLRHGQSLSQRRLRDADLGEQVTHLDNHRLDSGADQTVVTPLRPASPSDDQDL